MGNEFFLKVHLPPIVIIILMVAVNVYVRKLVYRRLSQNAIQGTIVFLNLILAVFWQLAGEQNGLNLPQLYYVPILLAALFFSGPGGRLAVLGMAAIYLFLENLVLSGSDPLWLQVLTVASFGLVGLVGFLVGTETQQKMTELIQLKEEVEAKSVTDSLTGLYNYRYFHQRFREEVERAKRYGQPLSLVLMDVDYFKKFNDKYGHLLGDAILQAVASAMKNKVREVDVLARYGGEEFVLILSQTDKEGARLAAARLQSAIRETWIEDNGNELRVTFSMGIATFPDDASDEKGLFMCADMALYQAKLTRNNICTFGA